ncbi:transposon Tf2-6 polyprotein [Trichonephila clavipes]|nr:transposon Tf2-6 polyprotein [Trichonephila clavipes]
MQFGLCNAVSTFLRFVDEVSRGLNFIYAFIDDILVASTSEAEHIQHLRLLFQRLDQYGLSINPYKCTFGVPTLNFLGFQVCSSGIKPLEDRVEAILKFPQPTTITELRIKNKKRPKRKVKIKPEEVLEWTDEATTAFELVKQVLAHATLLHHPMPNAPLSIWVDASDFAVGGALAQYHENNLVADALSHIEIDSISKASCLNYKDIAAARLVDEEIKQLLESNSTSLNLKQQYVPLEDITLTCDVSTNVSRPLILKDYRKIVFQHLHGLSHPGISASTKLATQRFVWPNIRRDIKAWVNSCHPCQRSKIHRPTKAPIGTFALPDARFFPNSR